MNATNNQLLGRMLQEAQGYARLCHSFPWFADRLENDCTTVKTVASEAPAPRLDIAEGSSAESTNAADTAQNEEAQPLKPLTDISWPPEPDASIFTDPLKRDDPKPLRREELMRIGE